MTPRYSLLTRTVALINLSRFLRLPTSKKVTADRGTQIRASATQQILHQELLPASFMFVPRYCTSDFEYIYRERFKTCLPECLCRDTQSTELNLYHDGKNTCHGSLPYGLKNDWSSRYFCIRPSVDSPTFTNATAGPLAVRRVLSGHMTAWP